MNFVWIVWYSQLVLRVRIIYVNDSKLSAQLRYSTEEAPDYDLLSK